MREGAKLKRKTHRGLKRGAALLLLLSTAAHALDFKLPVPLSDGSVEGVLNTTATAGVGVRMQSISPSLISKGVINPDVCGPPYQTCQGLFREHSFPAAHLAAAPGSANTNGEDGDLNYPHKGSIFQAPLKVTQDLTLKYGDFGIFARALFFYDAVNNDFTERHPNYLTPQNAGQVGRVGTTLPILNGVVGGPCSALAGPVQGLLGPVAGLGEIGRAHV